MKLCPQCTTGYPDTASNCPTHGGVLSEIRDLKPGMVIRRTYQIVRKLGQGGMGSVYLARQTLMDEPRALKFLASEFSNDQAFTSRFLREVRNLRQVRHKNVVDCGDLEPAEDDSLFFPMEFVDGPDLRELLQQAHGPLDVETSLEIARGIANGLGAAHALGLVHRDIKPENILMAQTGDGYSGFDSALYSNVNAKWNFPQENATSQDLQMATRESKPLYTPKIADFGIVATKESSRTHTTTGSSLLTPQYAAPEQWRGMKAADFDGRTDLYALGGVLFEMLAGRTVFEAENYEGWAEEHRNTPPRPPSSVRPELKNWQGLDGLVLRLLAKDREQRPRDVAEFLSWLEAVHYVPPRPRRITEVEPRPGRAQTILETHPAKVESVEPAALEPPEADEARPKKRFPFVGETIIAAVVLIVIFFSWQGSRDRNPGPVIDSSTQGQVAGQPGNANSDTAEPDTSLLEQQAETLLNQNEYQQAAPLFDQACTGGNAAACSKLGSLYASGQGLAANHVTAAEFFDKGCNGGFEPACIELSNAYLAGDGVVMDKDKANQLLQKACTLGDAIPCNQTKN